MIAAKVPLVCVETLVSLQESLEGELSLCRSFVSRYVEMWPGRFDRIHAAVTAGNNEAALDSVLSLRSSSLMVGAAQLGELATDLFQLLEYRNHAEALSKLPALQACGDQTACQLTAFCTKMI